MKHILILSIVFILFSCHAGAQANRDTTFLFQKKIINSYIISLDTFKLVSTSTLNGSLVFGEFKAVCLYDNSNALIYKIQFDFDTTTSKIIYFKDNKVLKIVDNQSEFYNIGKWVDANGFDIKSSTIENLLLLADQSFKTIKTLIF